MLNQVVELKREVTAVQIPSGDVLTLPEGERVYITQILGGSYTVATDHGLARISRENADALGAGAEEPSPEAAALDAGAEEAVLVEAEEPPQAARAAPMVTAPEASRKLRREIFFIRVNLLHGFPIKKFILKNSAPGVVGLC